MTRGDTTRFGIRLFAALAVALGLLTSTVLAARPPAPPPPPPTGTIYYCTRNNNPGGITYSAIKPDGTGQASNILPNIADLTAPNFSEANPAFSPSGSNTTHDRWWIYPATTGVYDHWIYADGTVSDNVPHRDLFAVRSDPLDRSQLITIQLTDLYGIVTFHAPSACWSNDPNNDPLNSFVTAYVYDLRGQFIEEADGTTIVDLSSGFQARHTRFPLTISEIQPGYVPFGPDSADESELDAILQPVMIFAGWALSSVHDGQGVIAPSGDAFLGNSVLGPSAIRLFIQDWASGAQSTLWDGSSGAPTSPWTAQWSPSGATIAIENRGFGSGWAGGDIWTQPASGSAPPSKVLAITSKGSNKTFYERPIWSPDNSHLVVVKNQYSGSTLTASWLTRVSITDGKTTDLVPLAITGGVRTVPLRWTSDN